MNGRSCSTRRSRRDAEAIAFARDQRARANEFARDLWQIVRNRGCRNQKFRREYPIPPYTADFCCVALELIVEVDGEHHRTEEGQERDERRDRFLAEQGYAVLRIPGYQVLRDAAAVRRLIENAIDQRIEHRGPLSPGLVWRTEVSLEGIGKILTLESVTSFSPMKHRYQRAGIEELLWLLDSRS